MSHLDHGKAIDWRRTKIAPERLKELNTRSDWKAFIQSAGYLAILLVSGGVTIYASIIENWWVFGVMLFLHGTFASFTINAVHELIHGTVFKTKWINTFFCELFGHIGWHNTRYFWFSHTEHHKFTLHPPDDLEVVVPITHSIKSYLQNAFFEKGFFKRVYDQAKLALGKFDGEWTNIILPESAKKNRKYVSNFARTTFLIHGTITAVSLYYGYWAIPLVVCMPSAYGGWLFLLMNNTQHVGLVENVNDFRLNCRTFYTNPFFRFLYWQMNYHIEHHMYAAVPCYNLHALNKEIRHELPRCPNGLLQTWVEIGQIMFRQKEDPDFRFVAELPEDNGGTLTNKSRLEQIREQGRSNKVRIASKSENNKRWECTICGFIYDEAFGLPEEGIAPGTAWADIPEDWACPDCGMAKADFEMKEILNENKSESVALDETEDPVIIIGSGHAGYNVAKEFRTINKSTPLIIISEEDGNAYYKPALSTALANKRDADALIQNTKAEMVQKLYAEIYTETSVDKIDREGKKVILSGGKRLPYSSLVLATGAEPIKLPLDGSASDKVISINRLEDYRNFRTTLKDNDRVTIIGGGLIGCEFANDLSLSGYKVDVVDLANSPLAQLIPTEMGNALLQKLEENGVHFHGNTKVSTVNEKNDCIVCNLDNGEEISANIVLSAVGLRPHLKLATEANIQSNRGIQVNEFMQTSDPDVYAIGDCCEQDSMVRPYIQPINIASKALAQSLNGHLTAVKYPVMPVLIKTTVCPIVVASPESREGQWVVDGSGIDLTARFLNTENKIIGFALSGEHVKHKNSLISEMEKTRSLSAVGVA